MSVIGFWVVQILWLIIDGDLDEASDLWDLDRSTWWILALAVANLMLAFRVRARVGTGRPCTHSAAATIGCSGLLLLVFIAHGARSDDLGVWPAAVGAVLSAASAARFRGTLTDPGDDPSRSH